MRSSGPRGACRLPRGLRETAPAAGARAASQKLLSGDSQVDRRGDVGGDRHVVESQQVEAGEQASEDRAGRVAAVEQSPPGDAARSGLRSSARWRAATRPSGSWAAAGRPRRAGRAAACPASRAPRRRCRPDSSAAAADAPAIAQDGDAHFQERVDAQRMLPGKPQAREPMLPMHRPPMKVASRTPSDTAVEPIASCSS